MTFRQATKNLSKPDTDRKGNAVRLLTPVVALVFLLCLVLAIVLIQRTLLHLGPNANLTNKPSTVSYTDLPNSECSLTILSIYMYKVDSEIW